MARLGLHNIGQTCCLNSLIQVFIMNVDFTKILKRMTVPRGVEEQKRSVPFQLLLLLEKMQDSRWKAVRPTELAYCLQKYNVPMFVQHDAAQLYLTIWNLIKDQITNVDLVERLQALYTIRMMESLVCLDCTVASRRNTSMLTLPLSLFDINLKPLKTLEDALRSFFQPRELSGKSKCFCENCEKKTRGKQALQLTHLPPTLTIHLMRFSIRNARTEKICHSLRFPQRLDFSQFLLVEQDFGAAEDRGGNCISFGLYEERILTLHLHRLANYHFPLLSLDLLILLRASTMRRNSDFELYNQPYLQPLGTITIFNNNMAQVLIKQNGYSHQ
ncbi:ubl carboxyl-terminal hydrolase 18 isoform X1 [Choloepus didactylus]|uniref:ubl carboxyl-terminal hydrolase 18 isoform X1 n=1 Tax=Choloepus didactylus TaxID=27675 RepID=UPI00189F6440|nr:ubl carboxyl-terminal hydrolase 18 isoform X1 [Choloepus didactylus]